MEELHLHLSSTPKLHNFMYVVKLHDYKKLLLMLVSSATSSVGRHIRFKFQMIGCMEKSPK